MFESYGSDKETEREVSIAEALRMTHSQPTPTQAQGSSPPSGAKSDTFLQGLATPGIKASFDCWLGMWVKTSKRKERSNILQIIKLPVIKFKQKMKKIF